MRAPRERLTYHWVGVDPSLICVFSHQTVTAANGTAGGWRMEKTWCGHPTPRLAKLPDGGRWFLLLL